MAHVSDVTKTLVDLIVEAVYPNGVDNPSVAGINIAVCEGWPIPSQLDEIMKDGNVMISVFPTNAERNTTRALGKKWKEKSISEDGLTGDSQTETKRQEKNFQISVWAPDNESRALISSIVDANLSDHDKLTFSDGSSGLMNYFNAHTDDDLQKEGTYREDLIYSVEYATILTRTDEVVKGTIINITT